MEEKEIWTYDDVEQVKSELNDKYLRLYADFENYRKRVQKEKEELIIKTKVDTLSTILDIDNDLSIAFKNEKSEGLKLIMNKLDNFLKSQGIESIQTQEYDSDIHEVITIVDTGKEGILDVSSKGYTYNGNIIRYPKVVLSR